MHVIKQVSNADKGYLLAIAGITKVLSVDDKDSKIAQYLARGNHIG
jgi:hypothetical protein